MLTPAEVSRLAKLARIRLSEAEVAQIVPQLEVILTAVARVSEAASQDVPLTSHALELTNVFRDDQVRESLPVDAVLAAAPAVQDGRFRVPRILAEES